MTARDFIVAATIGVLGAAGFCGGIWLVLDAYTRIAYASLGIPHPG